MKLFDLECNQLIESVESLEIKYDEKSVKST